MKRFALACLMLWPLSALAEGERAGDFDYYLLSLSWAPGWCATDGASRDVAQCDPANDATFVLHGLWPQYETGWPSYCRTTARDPSRAQSAAMEDVMGSDGAAWYQWKKHGRCAGLSAEDYYATARAAYESVTIPEVFSRLDRDIRLPASVVEEAFLEANPDLSRDQITITCKSGRIQEARICLTKDLEPRRCGRDTIRDCTMRDALMEAVR
ncbi:ribonuclease T2 family protein [Sedimentimonas flavescens]|uniref:ribonuclease T2 family protein n=1 Tax=Sedimentimonas flavescens TaxID=2851012 RepID=UPI001C4A6C8D|nr:ribonuclease T2 [Sedimentimonas flavescens]MBW0158701.1 ribonuclease T2 [Sedimentimonas flavescens]